MKIEMSEAELEALIERVVRRLMHAPGFVAPVVPTIGWPPAGRPFEPFKPTYIGDVTAYSDQNPHPVQMDA